MTPDEVEVMRKAENARLRSHGHRALSPTAFKARLVGDEKFRHLVMRLRHRRRPDRAHPLA